MKHITNFLGVSCVALLAMLLMAPGAFAQQYTPPDPPSDLAAAATEATAATITITWSPVADANNGGLPLLTGIAGYKLEVSEDPNAGTPVWTEVDLSTATVGDLTTNPVTKYSFNHDLTAEDPDYGITRHYRISAINGEGTGDPSAVVSATTHDVPAAPPGFTAVATAADVDAGVTGAGSITIEWDPVEEANNGGLPLLADASGYRLETTADLTADPVVWAEVTVVAPTGDATKFSATHSGLTAGATHHFRVKAVNAALGATETGGNYSSASATTHDVPDAPTGLAAAVSADASIPTATDITLSWTAPADNGGLAITSYEVQTTTTPADAASWTAVSDADATDLEAVHDISSAADPALTHLYRVVATSAAGTGEPSDLVGVKMAPPGAPTDLIVRAVDQQPAIALSWTAPVNDGEPAVTAYRIQMADQPDPTVDITDADWEDLQPAWEDNFYYHTGLTDGTRYHYRVSAINGISPSGASEAGGPFSDVESAISSNKAGMPRDLSAALAQDGDIDLSWNPPLAEESGGSAITGYKIEVSVDAGDNWTVLEEDKPTSELSTGGTSLLAYAYSHENPDPGTSNTYRVSAVNDAGPGAPALSDPVSTEAVLPGASTDLEAIAAMDAPSIELSWTAPDDGGANIDRWKIEVSTDAEATWADVDPALDVTDPDPTANPATTKHSAVHAGLMAGAMYHYRVSAITDAGEGPASNVASATAADIPNAPTGLTATADGENAIDLSWTAPESNGGSAIAGYKIEVSEDAGTTWEEPLVANTGNTDTEYRHTGLDAATTRHYRVSAINSATPDARTGAPSNVANATTAARGIVTRYAVSEDGSSSGNCTSDASPCTLGAALSASATSGNNNDVVLVRIRRTGETATIAEDVTISNMVTLGVYVRGANAAAKGAVSFSGSVKMADGGGLMTHKDASISFDELEIAGMSSIDKLTIGDDLTISEDDPNNDMTSVLAVDQLTVNSGQTLTVGNGANVRVRLTKGAVGKMNGKFDVKGTVDGAGGLWIAHTSDERAAGIMLHVPGDYQPNTAIAPSETKFTVDDCLMVTGGGTVENDLHFVAAGNVCVNLDEVGNLVAVGSISTMDDITTDVIFRNGVTVNGDVEQWNDARVLFESSSTIDGDLTLDYGDGGVGTDFGTPISAPADFERAMGSGVEFAGASNTIEGDLNLKFDGETGSTMVLLSVDNGQNHMSTVEGDLIIEDGGGIHLEGHPGVAPFNTIKPRAHNLTAEGDVFVYEDATIMMEHAATSTIESGLCSAPGLRHGTKVMLEGDIVFTQGKTLTIPTVVIADDVEVEEEGTLMATTVHVTEDGELNADENVDVRDALILQGDGLEGSLAASSTVNKLTYGTVDSDEIDLGASVASLSVSVGADKELRISEAVTVTNLGLCSGTVVLIDTDTEAKTLTVTDMLAVMDGHLELDANRPGNAGTDVSETPAATDGYILLYVTAGERMAGMEWFAPRKVAVNNKDAVIIVNEAKSLDEGVHIFNGDLHMKGEGSDLTIGMRGVSGLSPFVMVDNGELQSNGSNVVVHGTVTVATADKQAGKIVTGGGELHVLGMTSGKDLNNASAVATVGGNGTNGGVGMIDVGAGALQLGPEAMNPKDGLHGDWQYPIDNADARPHVQLDVNEKGSVMGMVRVPGGSKQTEVIGVNFDAIVFDGTKTPNKNTVNDGNPLNWDGTLYVIDAAKNVTVDSLGASNGAVEFRGTKATVNKDVAASSVAIYQELKTLEFKGDLAISGNGGFSSRGGADGDRRSVMIGGDYSQDTEQKGGINMHDPEGGSYLSAHTDKTVMGAFMTSGTGEATRYSTQSGTSLTLKGDFDFGLTAAGYMLNADLEFSGKEAQTVGSAVDLGDVLVNNSAGLVLSDNVSQGASSMLTLTSGVISTDGASTWMVKNPNIEEDVRGRNNALTTCDDDENCASVISGGSRRAHMTAGVSRHVMKGNSGEGEMSGGYLFPVGGMSGDRSHYRPLILQLEDDLSEAMPVTVSSMMGSDDAGEINIVVPVQGGSLTLNAYADMFWKVESKEVPDQNSHIRVAASGLANVFDDSRLRMVQWDCDWSNARLAGMQIVGSDADSFAENGYVNGVLNLTQQSVELGTCAILGVASNGIENPIHMDPLTGGLARIQFIHNLPLPFPVDLFLDGVKLMGGLNFQSATGYGHYAAGDHVISVMPVVPPGVPAAPIEIPLPSLVNEQNYAVIAHGSVADPKIQILSTKLRSSVDNMVDAILVHGSGDLGDVDVRILDPADNMTPTKLLANNFGFNSATRYISLEAGAHNVQVTSPDNREEVNVYYLDLNGYQGETLVLNLSGGKDDLGFMGVRTNGDVFLSQVVTGVEEEGGPEIPTEFTLHGNYPNPFNPSTRIEFDLPESAQVTVQVVDMLGRQVMTLPAQEIEAGANRTLELNATNLASGHYLYRMIATGAENQYVKTGRMTLVK